MAQARTATIEAFMERLCRENNLTVLSVEFRRSTNDKLDDFSFNACAHWDRAPEGQYPNVTVWGASASAALHNAIVAANQKRAPQSSKPDVELTVMEAF